MLAINLFEFLRRLLGILLRIEQVESLVVQLVRRLVGSQGVFVEQAARSDTERKQAKQHGSRSTASAARNPVDADPTPAHELMKSRG
jgi:hypothetical protein